MMKTLKKLLNCLPMRPKKIPALLLKKKMTKLTKQLPFPRLLGVSFEPQRMNCKGSQFKSNA
ncbi:hypothetical protein GBA52_003706 [Prunus armeniaca]|nr:hypothetical protein GBA52_003706 [Prunus armeniaca]